MEELQEELKTLSRRARCAIQGKITSKKISTWLKGDNVITSSITSQGQDDDDVLEGDDEDDEEEEEDDPRIHLLHDEEGYLSDLSTVSNEEGIIMADDSTLRDSTSRESARRRLMRRAISLEDLNTVSAIHHHSHHLLDQDSLPERPSSSASMSLPVPSDTLPSLQHTDDTLYHRYYHLRSRERPSDYHTLLSDDNQYSLYRLDQDHQGPVRTMSPDADIEELALMDDVKSTRSSYTTNPTVQDHFGEAGKEETAGAVAGGPLSWLNASSLLEALVNWVEGPPNRPQPKKNPNEKPNPILEIPFQFIALLTYPEPDPKAGDKMTLAMVRETTFVRQRRKTLMMLTAYTLVVRYCSFDFFLVVLFASNCGMLFLMKNSGRMNVNMAKRAVGQRVGWAKQWAGGFFRRGTINSNNGNDTMTLHQGVTTSNASSSKSLPNILSAPAESIRGVGGAISIAGEKAADSAQENSPQIKRRGLFGKRKTYTTSLAPSQRIGASSASILSPTTPGAEGDDVSVMTGRTTKRGFFKRSTTFTNRSATAPPPTTALDGPPPQPPTPITAKHSTNSSTSMAATAAAMSILTSKSGTPALSTSPQPQSQSLSQLDLMLPARSPSPSALRKEFSLGSKPWGNSGSASSVAVAVATAPAASTAATGSPSLQLGQTGTQTVNSSASSGNSSPNSSPKSASANDPGTAISSSSTASTSTTAVSAGRSLASAINPRSLLSSFTSQSQKQQQQQQQQVPASATSPVSSTFSQNTPSIVTTDIITPTTTETAIPISPRPIKPAGPRTGFLTSSLSTSKLSVVLRRGSGDGGIGGGDGMCEEEERLEFAIEHQAYPQHFNPQRRASTNSTANAKQSLSHEALFRKHQYQQSHPYAVGGGQDHPTWQISSAGSGTGLGLGDGMSTVREFLQSERRSISSGGGGGVGMKEDLLDPVTSAAAGAMEGFDREA
ncbi:hypothetical protein BGX23_008490 [Mortierella sp. AD031]|nr:hypothetical protein BGX23_008490 [Mortierella sp. AD031]